MPVENASKNIGSRRATGLRACVCSVLGRTLNVKPCGLQVYRALQLEIVQ